MAKTTSKHHRYEPPRSSVAMAATETSERYPDVYTNYHPGAVRELQSGADQVYELELSGALVMRIEVWSSHLLRVRIGKDFLSEAPSYAINPACQPETTPVVTAEHADYWELSTPALLCSIDRTSAQITISDRTTGVILLQEVAPATVRETLLEGIDQVRAQFASPADAAYYGLGDKSWDLDLRGRYFQNWCTDAFAYEEDTDPLYRAIPVYYSVHDGQAYGLFLHNTWRTHFDFAAEQSDRVTIWADGGELDYFFLYGPDLLQATQRYHWLTGVPELPPLWALGYHQCRWSYYPEARVREVAATFREQSIPCDAIYLDIDYMDGYRCFTWNENYFPDPTALIADLRAQGFHTVVMIDPGIKVDEDYSVYREGIEQDVFCRRTSQRHMVGPVWPPECVWPDYTNPQVRQWWGLLYRQLYNEQGVSGFWNDMNEPAMFKVNRMTFPDEVLHDCDGFPGNHRRAHNVYGQQMSRATYEGLKTLQPKKRPFVLTRASFSGGQRYAALWTGDNIASWAHLRLASLQCQRLSMSGYSLCGSDVGGFVETPDGELYVRWVQLACFHPVFRTHSMGNNEDGAAEADADRIKEEEKFNRLDQEPWAFGEPYTSQARAAINLRYRLLPYLYTAFYDHQRTGQPVLRSLVAYDHRDAHCRRQEVDFMFGPDLLVSPIFKRGPKTHRVYLPQGNWYSYHTHRHYSGQAYYRRRVRADYIPLFVRAGAILPEAAGTPQHTAALLATTLVLRCWVAPTGGGQFYWDAGEGYGYTQGDHHLRTFAQQATDSSWKLVLTTEGNYTPELTHIELRIVGLDFVPVSARADDTPVDFVRERTEITLSIPYTTQEVYLHA